MTSTDNSSAHKSHSLLTSLVHSIREGLHGGAAAAVASIILQPLDVLRTKQQIITNDSKYRTIGNAIRSIYAEDGMRGFWRGTGPTIIRVLPGGSLFYFSLTAISEIMKRGEQRSLSPSEALFAGLAARLIGCAALQPVTVVKTRFEAFGKSNNYRGTFHALSSIAKTEGFRGLYAGLIPTILRDVPYSGINFANNFFNNYAPVGASYFVSAGTSGFLATLITHPFDVVRTRLQAQIAAAAINQSQTTTYVGSVDAFVKILKHEGARTFLRGLAPRLVRRPLTSAITWTLFELLGDFSLPKNS